MDILTVPSLAMLMAILVLNITSVGGIMPGCMSYRGMDVFIVVLIKQQSILQGPVTVSGCEEN